MVKHEIKNQEYAGNQQSYKDIADNCGDIVYN